MSLSDNSPQQSVQVPMPNPLPASQHHAGPTRQFEHELSRSVKQSRDRAQYVRQQKGHSLILHLTLGVVVLWIPAIYYSFSPNHYWHA